MVSQLLPLLPVWGVQVATGTLDVLALVQAIVIQLLPELPV